jgi:phosphoribosylaminoimidazolecarboxamide formyltransferase/IMP cyclohydrolase
MGDLKAMYSTVQKDTFPDRMTIQLGSDTLVYEKRIWTLDGERKGLRYGENPDQPAALYALKEGSLTCGGLTWRGPGQGIVSEMSDAQMIQAGKHPGKTNLTDVDNGANILQNLTARPAVVILKHNNPCGAAWDEDGIGKALQKAYDSDRIAAFGGAVVVNRPFTMDAAEFMATRYFEVVAAPAYEEGCIERLKSRKNLRILELPGLATLETFASAAFLDIRSLADGGLIIQKSFQNRILSPDDLLPATATTPQGLSVMARRPSPKELEDLCFAWAVEAGVTSNSVIFAKDGATIAIGTGEQDRVGCVELAVHKAYTKYADALAFKEQCLSLYELRKAAENSPEQRKRFEDIEARAIVAKGGLDESVLVSDGFFPFRDGVDVAIREGVRAIAQPGGSLRDAEVIQACNQAVPQVAMVFTGQRSFRH